MRGQKRQPTQRQGGRREHGSWVSKQPRVRSDTGWLQSTEEMTRGQKVTSEEVGLACHERSRMRLINKINKTKK